MDEKCFTVCGKSCIWNVFGIWIVLTVLNEKFVWWIKLMYLNGIKWNGMMFEVELNDMERLMAVWENET